MIFHRPGLGYRHGSNCARSGPGCPNHVTQRCNRRQATFLREEDYRVYLDLMAEWCSRRGVAIWAYCLMPNHVHLIAVPESVESLARGIGEAHRRYTRYVNFREGWRGFLWQGRFSSFVMDERYLLAATRYVELNPVRARLVRKPTAYEWSSARAHVTGEAGRFKGLDWSVWREAGGLEGWRELIERKGDMREEMLLRRCTYAGRPYGEEEFVKGLEEEFRRSWRRWGFEKKGAEGSKK